MEKVKWSDASACYTVSQGYNITVPVLLVVCPGVSNAWNDTSIRAFDLSAGHEVVFRSCYQFHFQLFTDHLKTVERELCDVVG